MQISANNGNNILSFPTGKTNLLPKDKILILKLNNFTLIPLCKHNLLIGGGVQLLVHFPAIYTFQMSLHARGSLQIRLYLQISFKLQCFLIEFHLSAVSFSTVPYY